jgi:uncharacterized RDD family membrane protein YckC
MSPPPGEAGAAASQQAGTVDGDNRPDVRRRPVDAVDPGTIPPQVRAVHAPDNMRAPLGAVRTALNGATQPGASMRRSARSGDLVTEAPLPAHAGVVTRLLAAAVDAVLVVLLAAALDLAAAGARFLWSPVSFRWPRPTTEVLVVAVLAVAVLYLTAGWALAGRTYGSRLMGLRVLSSRLRLLGWTRSLVRALTCVIWPIGLLWCGVSRTRSSVADLVVRSVVVYDAQPYARV